MAGYCGVSVYDILDGRHSLVSGEFRNLSACELFTLERERQQRNKDVKLLKAYMKQPCEKSNLST